MYYPPTVCVHSIFGYDYYSYGITMLPRDRRLMTQNLPFGRHVRVPNRTPLQVKLHATLPVLQG